MITDSQIPSEIIENIRKRERVTLSAIYKDIYPMVEKYVRDNNGSSADAQDIFQDAMFILIKKVEDVNFNLTSKLSTFLFGIGKNLWLKKLTKKGLDKKDYTKDLQLDLIVEEDDHLKLIRVKKMRECLEDLGEPCKTIIVQFYYMKTSMQEIAKMLHYTNANNAKNQKYKCFMRLKKMLLKKD